MKFEIGYAEIGLEVRMMFQWNDDCANFVHDLISKEIVFNIEYTDEHAIIVLSQTDFESLEFKDEALVVM